MKVLTAALAGAVALTWTADAFAGSKSRKRQSTYQSYQTDTRRSNTTAANGLCQRDTGVPNSQLNFRDKCDTQEFWARIQGNSGRR